jgi:hypothetical protein
MVRSRKVKLRGDAPDVSNERMNEMARLAAGTLGAIVILAAVVSAHEVTYEGTVVALQTARYAQPEGGFREVQELEVTVVDAKTNKPMNRVFTITDRTRVQRDGKRVTLAEAGVQNGDRVAVVVDHDKPGDEAIEVRLPARR